MKEIRQLLSDTHARCRVIAVIRGVPRPRDEAGEGLNAEEGADLEKEREREDRPSLGNNNWKL